MEGGNVITIKGNYGFFNPTPLIDDSWLKGVISNDDWVEIIKAINEGARAGKL